MKATDLDWPKLDNFSPGEWPDGVLEQMHASVIRALQDIRSEVGAPLFPSPVKGAHVRDEGTSQHSTDGGRRLSNATDFFCDPEHLPDVAAAALAHPEVHGIGIYDGMKFRHEEPGAWAMVHIDTRPSYRRRYWTGKGRDPVDYRIISAPELASAALWYELDKTL